MINPIPRIPIDLFEVLIAAAESKNLYEAGERLGLSQAAVSIKLKILESHLPMSPFTFQGKRKVLSHYGRALYEMAKAQGLQIRSELEALNRRYAGAEELTLRVGSRPELFEAVASGFHFPGRVEYVESTGQESIQKLLGHKIDIAISYEKPDSSDVMAKKIFSNGCSFIVSTKLLSGKKLTQALASQVEFLKKTPALIYQTKRDPVWLWLKHLQMDPSSIQVRFAVEDWRLLRDLVEKGLGWAIVPDYLLTGASGCEAVSLPENVIPKLTFYFLYQKELKQLKAFRKIHALLE